MVDQKIKDHVIALSRAYTGVETAKAAAIGLDDAALKSVESVGADLEEVSRAMAEMEGAQGPRGQARRKKRKCFDIFSFVRALRR